jgi:putative redox protein
MKQDVVTLKFDSNFVGDMTSPTGHTLLGNQENGLKPYHLLFGALGSCFYATFLSVAHKMKLSFDHAIINVSGDKRETIPTTLEYIKIELTVVNPSDEGKLEKAAHLGAKYCSIHETISKDAKIDLDIIFK